MDHILYMDPSTWNFDAEADFQVILLINFFVVRYYNHSTEKEFFTTLVCILTLTLTMLCVFLTPVDIYATSVNATDETSRVILILYYSMSLL